MKRMLQDWWRRNTLEDDTPFDNDSFSFVGSFSVHLVILLILGFTTLTKKEHESMLISSSVEEVAIEPEPEVAPQEVFFSNTASDVVGANSVNGDAMALSLAPVVADVSDVPSPVDQVEVSDVANVEINNAIQMATGLNYSENKAVKGAAGVGETGAVGAVDRITHEIILSLEERKTLVVWLFDQSPSMIRQRSTVNERFDRIYRELGVVEAAGMEAFKKHEDKPLLTTVMAFGDKVSLVTKQPTDDLAEIKKAVASIPSDTSGNEMTFQGIIQAAREYSKYRIPSRDGGEPDRNVLIVCFTDEVGSDQLNPQFGVDAAVKMCRRYQMPVYVVGVPAPFGRDETKFKWVDPDPKFDQDESWAVAEQGPETLYSERIKLSFMGSKDEEEALDSGFGPYSLTRICYETGGIYFAVHPNRNVYQAVGRGQTEAFSAHIKHFFDPQIMQRYRPDYIAADEYLRRVNGNRCRSALLTAAKASQVGAMESPQLRFVKRSEAEFGNDLSEAQRESAKLEPKLAALFDIIKEGEADREKETVLRWQAGYDLAIGRVMAARVRTEAYNAMLAAAKRGLNFKDKKNNTWMLEPSDEISVGSQYVKMADRAKMYLERVVNDHSNTPWSLLAERELKQPLGWKWNEEYTDLTPQNAGDGNGNAPAPANDAKMMLKGPPKRPAPKKI